MEILGKFGFEPVLFLAQIVNFFILLWILKKFLYGPVVQTLKKRKHDIEQGIKQASEARLAYEKAVDKEKEIMRKAQADARVYMDDAKKQATRMIQVAKEETKKQAETILKEAREQIASDAKEAEKRLTVHIGKLAMHMLEKSAGALFTKQDQQAVVKRAVQLIKEKNKTN